MKKNLIFLMFASLLLISTANGQKSPKDKGLDAITMGTIQGQLEFLASDWTEGRATGEKGFYMAADYVASMMKVFGVDPAGDPEMRGGRMGRGAFGPQQGMRQAPPKSYFQNFTLIESLPGAASDMTIVKGGREYTFEDGIDFSVSRASISSKFDAPIVFIGYGMVDKANGIDDLAGVDLKGKIVLRLSGFPGYNDPSSAMYKKLAGDNPRFSFTIMRSKNEVLNDRGILAVIDITPNTDVAKRWGVYKFDNNPAPAESNARTNWTSMRLDGREISSTPLNITVTDKIANLLLKDSPVDVAKYEIDAAAGTLKFKPVTLPGEIARISTSVKSRRVNVRNVVAMIEGENPDEIVVAGAHLDHMGIDNGKIWNGADDNASGVVAVTTIAKAFAASGVKPKRTILFCAWTGEEKGLYGSEYFTLYPPIGKISDIKFYMNFDMIARDAVNDTAKNMAGITYTKSFPKLEEMTRSDVASYKLDLNLNIRSADSPTGGSDYTAFSENKIPVIAWMAAMHPDYHQPSDQVNLVNWPKMLNIIKLGYLQMWEAANGEIK